MIDSKDTTLSFLHDLRRRGAAVLTIRKLTILAGAILFPLSAPSMASTKCLLRSPPPRSRLRR
jgi:hypothetical protein